MIDAPAGSIVVYSDIACPWATCAVWRLHRARERAGLAGKVQLDHRAFPLELANERPTPKRVLDAEVPVVGGIEPEFGFRIWSADDFTWPVTVLPALEAVQAAKAQSLAASETLDLALRRAFFAESRCIALRNVVLDVARSCEGVDVDQLAKALDHGDSRHAVMEQFDVAQQDDVKGSPHVFLPGGRSEHNPGVQMHWEGEHGSGFPVVDADDPSVYDDLVRAAVP